LASEEWNMREMADFSNCTFYMMNSDKSWQTGRVSSRGTSTPMVADTDELALQSAILDLLNDGSSSLLRHICIQLGHISHACT